MKRIGAVLLLVSLAGCASQSPYKDALVRFGKTGRAVQAHLEPAGDASVQALYDAFDAAVTEALTIEGK